MPVKRLYIIWVKFTVIKHYKVRTVGIIIGMSFILWKHPHVETFPLRAKTWSRVWRLWWCILLKTRPSWSLKCASIYKTNLHLMSSWMSRQFISPEIWALTHKETIHLYRDTNIILCWHESVNEAKCWSSNAVHRIVCMQHDVVFRDRRVKSCNIYLASLLFVTVWSHRIAKNAASTIECIWKLTHTILAMSGSHVVRESSSCQ